MNPWCRTPVNQNPYRASAFRIAGVPREVTRRRTVAQLIAQTRQIVRTDPSAHLVEGVPVTEAEVNAAEAVLLDPERRIVEELLAHAAERLPMERLRELTAELRGQLSQSPTTSGVLAPWLFRQWLEKLRRCVPADLPAADASLGSLELELEPPF